jgi:hypothetical protein
MESSRISGLHRRDFIQVAAAGAALIGAGVTAARVDQPWETRSAISAQPAPAFGSDRTKADILVETLIAWGATHAFGSSIGQGVSCTGSKPPSACPSATRPAWRDRG